MVGGRVARFVHRPMFERCLVGAHFHLLPDHVVALATRDVVRFS